MERYEKLKKVGEGTYGIVYKAINKETQQVVALKKIRMGNIKDGVSFTAIREIKALQQLHHPNIIGLLDIFSRKSNIYLVFEFMESDLEAVIKDKNTFLSPADIKSYMLMLLKGIEACHKNWILHRDLKPNNLLLAADGTMKLADFGFARQYGSPNPHYTHQIVTIWYRAPELLLGANKYGPAVDMWAIGCIFAELMLRTPYFAGENEMEQLTKIFTALGTPTEEIWPGMTNLPLYIEFTRVAPTPFKQLFTAATEDAIDLLSQLLRFNPAARITASDALKHPYFSNAPPPTPIGKLPLPPKASTESPISRVLSPGKRHIGSDGGPSKHRRLNDDDITPKRLDFD